MEWLFSWEVTSWTVGLLVAIAFGVLALDDFKLAKLCFLLAAADALGGIVMAVSKSQLSSLAAVLTVFVVAGLVGVLALISWQYVDRKEQAKKPKEKKAEPSFSITHGTIEVSGVTITHPQKTTHHTRVFITATVTNDGDAPSPIKGWKLSCRLNDGRSFTAGPWIFSGPTEVIDPTTGDKFSFPQSASLFAKGAEPIESKRSADGYVTFLFPPDLYKSMWEAGVLFTLEITDMNGKPYTHEIHMTGVQATDGLKVTPGMIRDKN